MKVEFGNPQDIDLWMGLVGEVRWNFPGLETQEKLDEHKSTVLKFMSKRQAVCVKEGNEIAGVMLFSRGHNMIYCLAVSPAYCRRHAASMLMEEALRNLDRTREISVSTFRADDEKGTAPRAFYEKYGFVEDALIEEMDYPNQKYVLHSMNTERKSRQISINKMPCTRANALRTSCAAAMPIARYTKWRLEIIFGNRKEWHRMEKRGCLTKERFRQIAKRKEKLSLRTSDRCHWCGNPPDFSGRYQEVFPSDRGIPTPLKRTGSE